MQSKKTIQNQQYEDYWRLTLEYSDIHGVPFNKTLELIILFIDEVQSFKRGWTSTERNVIQNRIFAEFKKANKASTRKSLNQFLKLGFINNSGKGYHRLAKEFLVATNKAQKKMIFSKILYENSSFSRSYSNPSNSNETNFFIKTLEETKSITGEELLGLIYTDVSLYKRGFLSREELDLKVSEINNINFEERKYNQRNYIRNVFKKLDEVTFKNDTFYLSSEISDEETTLKATGRDPYLQRLYKKELIDEIKNIYGSIVCSIEQIPYPVLIASHIKPYRFCDENEAFNKNNGLLLSKNLDSLFDLGYISFSDTGDLIYSDLLEVTVIENLNDYSLPNELLNPERLSYLNYHRRNILKKG